MLTATFDADTALHPDGDGRFRAHVDPSWFVVDAPNGGLFAALAVRALEATVGQPPRSLTVHYLRGAGAGPLDLAVHVERSGRTTSFVRLTFAQAGETVALALAACAPFREGQLEWDDTRAPEAPPPLECEPLPAVRELPPYLGKYEIRWLGWDPARRPAWIGGWIRAAQERPADHVLLAALTDAFMPPAFLRMGGPGPVPTVDLTLHFRAPAPPGPHPWVLGRFVTRLSAGGVCEEDGELWSEGGRLLVQSRQLAIVRRRDAA